MCAREATGQHLIANFVRCNFKLTFFSKSINLLVSVVHGPIDPGREQVVNGVDRAGLPMRELRLQAGGR